MGACPHDGPRLAAVNDVAHGPSILGVRSLGKPGGRGRQNPHILGNSGALPVPCTRDTMIGGPGDHVHEPIG
jgi:hypothetical protein